MKQIFDWLREQFEEKSVQGFDGNGNPVNVRFVASIMAEDIITEAELKLEADCCEWEWFEVDGVRTYANCKYSRDTLDLREMSDFQFCPYCGRKISEVE